MDTTILEAELSMIHSEWNELGYYFDKTEEKILDNLRNDKKEWAKKHFENLKEIENKMRPLRNNLINVYENLAQFSSEKGKHYEETKFKEKAEEFYKNRYIRNERSLKLIGILNRNGIEVQ